MEDLVKVDNMLHKSSVHPNMEWMESIKYVDIGRESNLIEGDEAIFVIRSILNNKEINKVRDKILKIPHDELCIEIEVDKAFKCFLLKYDENINRIIQLDRIGEDELIVFNSENKEILDSVIHKENEYSTSSIIQGRDDNSFLAVAKEGKILNKLKKNTKYISLDKGINIYRKEYKDGVLNDIDSDRLAHYFRRDNRRLKCLKKVKNISGKIEKYREYNNEGGVIKFANKGVRGLGKSKPVFSLDLHGFTAKWARNALSVFFDEMIKMGVTCFGIIYGVSGNSMERETRNFIKQKNQIITKWKEGSVLINMKEMTSHEKRLKWIWGKKKNQSEFASIDVLEYRIYAMKIEGGRDVERNNNFGRAFKRAARCVSAYRIIDDSKKVKKLTEMDELKRPWMR